MANSPVNFDLATRRIHDRQHGINMLVQFIVCPKQIARVVIVTTMYHCRCCQALHSKTVELYCN